MIQSARIFACALSVAVLFAAGRAPAEHKAKNEDCLSCHSDATLATEANGQKQTLFVDAEKLKHSVHGNLFTCIDCHKDVKGLVHETPPKNVSCADCHADQQSAYAHSLHARQTASGAPEATCQDCHGEAHQILAVDDPKSPMSRANIPPSCGRCHGQKFLMESNGESAQAFISYQQSVHGMAVEKGSQKAAVCTDCHGAHAILEANDQHSPIYKFNVPATCGKCHNEIERAFQTSIHGQGIARGNGLAPVCTDCHGIHSIKPHKDPLSPVSEQNLSRDTCARCHEGVRLSQEFGLPSNRVSTYNDSYHGLAAEGGSIVAANCSSCHGVHNILPSSDPHSTIYRANLKQTCGKCHKGVTQKFTLARVHLGDGPHPKDIDSVAVRWIRLIYLPLIIVVIGVMLLHNAIIWRSKMIERRRAHPAMIVRMTVNQRSQHIVVLLSFIVLVVTGFALKFPESWFAQLLGMNEKWRSVIHRVAGVALIAAGIYHVFYLAAAREGRRLLRDVAPWPKDVSDAVRAIRYHLGMSKQKPRFARFNYAEKVEYWALVWGTGLMGITGIMLCAKVWVGNLLARWWVDVATAIHFYEAILATLAILVWHFYLVIFDPDVYPMNGAWLDGKMPLDLYREEHTLDTESLAEADQQEAASKASPNTGSDHSPERAES